MLELKSKTMENSSQTAVMKYCIDKSECFVASDQIPAHMNQQNVANSIDNGYFSVDSVEAFGPKPSTQTPEDRRHSLST